MKKMSRPAITTGMGLLLLLFLLSLFLLAKNQSLFSTLTSVFQKHPAVPKARKSLWLATGLPNGSYYALGKAIAEISQQGIDIRVCTSKGSYDNIGLLQEGRVSLALAQVDAFDAVVVHGEMHEISKDLKDLPEACDKPEGPASQPALVTYLYSEMVHMFLRPHFYVNSPADLKHVAKQVWLGPSGSGTRVTAERLLQASGIPDRDISQLFANNQIKDWTTASKKLLAPINDNGRLYAFFWTRAAPTLNWKNDPPAGRAGKDQDPVYYLLDGEARIAALPPEIIERMTEDSLYVATTIPLTAYGKKIKQGVPTVGIASVLIADKSISAEEINDLIGMLNSNKSNIERRIEVAGAQSHLKAPDLKFVWLTAIGSAAALLLLLIYRPPRWLSTNLPAVWYATLLSSILLFLWYGFAVKMTEAEGRFNPSFETTATSMRTILFYVVGSFRDRKLMTRQGENLIAWALFVIPLVFGWLTSDIIREGVRKLSHWLPGCIRRLGTRSASSWLLQIVRAMKRPGRKHAPVPNA